MRIKLFSLLALIFVAGSASAESVGIHFVAAGFSQRTDSALNNNFASQASRVRWDLYMPGTINDNGFLFIDGPKVKLRNIDGSIIYRTKSGSGDCTGNFAAYDPVHTPSSAELVRMVGDIAYIRVRSPLATKLFQDNSKIGTACSLPDFGIFATMLDGSSPPGSTIKNAFSPDYQMDIGVQNSQKVDNHVMYAEFPINVKTPGDHTYSFTFSHDGTAGTAHNKVVWFGTISIDRNSGSVPAPRDGYTLGGYIPPVDPSTTPPNDPPTNLGGGGGGPTQTPQGAPIKIWIKDVINQLLGGAMSILRAGATSAQARGEEATAAATALNAGTMSFDPVSSAVALETFEAAPYSGTLRVTAEITSVKTGKVTTVKLPAVTAIAGQPSVLNFAFRGKLKKALTGKGKVKVTLRDSFKPAGSKKSFEVSSKPKL